MMDLPYFLEMVDIKHRYGSNLRTYHAEWKKADTHENYFYWLDHGEGKDVELPTVSMIKTWSLKIWTHVGLGAAREESRSVAQIPFIMNLSERKANS